MQVNFDKIAASGQMLRKHEVAKQGSEIGRRKEGGAPPFHYSRAIIHVRHVTFTIKTSNASRPLWYLSHSFGFLVRENDEEL